MGKLPKFEDWTPPWGKDDETFDAEKAKKYIYDLTRDKETLTAEKAQVAQDRDQHKAKVEEFESKDLSEVDRLKRELEQAKAAPKEDAEARLENARLTLALDNGLTAKQAKRLRGSTPEELEADLPELLELLGEQAKEKETSPPRGRFRTGNDDGDLPDELDPDKLVKYVQ